MSSPVGCERQCHFARRCLTEDVLGDSIDLANSVLASLGLNGDDGTRKGSGEASARKWLGFLILRYF